MIRFGLAVLLSVAFLLNVAIWGMGYSRRRIDVDLTDCQESDLALEMWRLWQTWPSRNQREGFLATLGHQFEQRFAISTVDGKLAIALARPVTPSDSYSRDEHAFGPIRYQRAIASYPLLMPCCGMNPTSDRESENRRRSARAFVRSVHLPAWLPLPILGLYPFTFFVRRPWRRWRWKRAGRCVVCGYDLRGSVRGACSECGAKA